MTFKMEAPPFSNALQHFAIYITPVENFIPAGQSRWIGSVACANLVGWLDEILPASAVSQTEVRTHRDHDLCQMVLPIFPELAGS